MSLYFFSLFSIAFYPVTLGSLAILVGLLAVNFGARTLGYTAIGFGSFLFYLLYFIRLLCQRLKHTKLYLVCSFMIQHNMTASTTMLRCNFLKHWIISSSRCSINTFSNRYIFGAYAQSCFVRAYNVEEKTPHRHKQYIPSSSISLLCLSYFIYMNISIKDLYY